MKKVVYLLFAAIIIMNLGCSRNNKISQNANSGSRNSDSIDVTIDSIENDTSELVGYETLSDKDLWLMVRPSDIKSDLSKRLVDAYNASVVQNSIFSDFDLLMRFDDDIKHDVEKAIKSLDVTKVNDTETSSKLAAYQKEMLYLLTVNPGNVDQNVHNPWKAQDDLFEYLSKKYNVSTFGKLDEDKYWAEYNSCPSVPEWKELKEKRGDKGLVKELRKKYGQAKDFDAQCVYAIELAHAYDADLDSWTDDDFKNPAISVLESLMKKRQYSLYLNELWRHWRVLYQDSQGASKDSEIPNRLYNIYRNICACTILSYIEEHPQDIYAINEFLVMACKENIFREGEYSYGNQAAIEKYYLFPERYGKE